MKSVGWSLRKRLRAQKAHFVLPAGWSFQNRLYAQGVAQAFQREAHAQGHHSVLAAGCCLQTGLALAVGCCFEKRLDLAAGRYPPSAAHWTLASGTVVCRFRLVHPQRWHACFARRVI